VDGAGTISQSSRSMSQQAHPIQGNINMNTRLTIRLILTAAALAAVIGVTSAVSAAWAGGVGAQGAAGPTSQAPSLTMTTLG
jgi:hypothetical protein